MAMSNVTSTMPLEIQLAEENTQLKGELERVQRQLKFLGEQKFENSSGVIAHDAKAFAEIRARADESDKKAEEAIKSMEMARDMMHKAQERTLGLADRIESLKDTVDALKKALHHAEARLMDAGI